MNKRSIGIDGSNFELEFKDCETVITEAVKVKNSKFEYGEINMIRGKPNLFLCLPKYYDTHNAIPVKMDKAKYFGSIVDSVTSNIKSRFKAPCKTTLTSIEMNITEVFPGCDCEKLRLMFNNSMLDHLKQNVRYDIKSKKHPLRPFAGSIVTRTIKGRYKIKIYDKKQQLESEFGINIDDEILRIEVVFNRLSVKKMFGTKRNLKTVLSKMGLNTLIDNYICVLSEVINS